LAARSAERLIDKACTVSDLSAHYGASLPVSVPDALEAGPLALTMDEARRTHSVIDMPPTWHRFDAALEGADN